MKDKKFTLGEYATNHPSGTIGRMLLKVEDLMLKGKDIPFCSSNDKLIEVISTLSEKRCGCLLIVDDLGVLEGVFTDGDLRRAIEKNKNFLNEKIKIFMTKNPKWISKDKLVVDAMKEMEKDPKKLVTILPVLKKNRKIIGIIRMHDILSAGLKKK
jgi:arabinose-5-phosphate isomerase